MRAAITSRTIVGLLAAGLIGLAGCDTKGTAGGPGAATSTDNKPLVGESEQAFHITTPSLSTTIKQGENKEVTIGISRGKNFDQDVVLKISGLPQGVTIDPANVMIKHDAKDVQVVVMAAPDAAVGDFTAHVVAHPTTGPDATNDVKFSVAKK